MSSAQFATTPLTDRFGVIIHDLDPGDVLIWDQRAVLHRGTPWPYDQPRTLASLCTSMLDDDGVAAAREFVAAQAKTALARR